MNTELAPASTANRLPQAILAVSTLVASWLGMQAVHELGHVLGAWTTGGVVERVLLHPLTISRTDLNSNPRPLLVVWAGPIVGVALPVLSWLVFRSFHWRGDFVLRFFAGFCLIANGAYIAFGSFGKIGDCGEMLRHGSDAWQLWLFGLITIPAGFGLWHRQGCHFGLGDRQGNVDISVAYATSIIAVAVLAFGFLNRS